MTLFRNSIFILVFSRLSLLNICDALFSMPIDGIDRDCCCILGLEQKMKVSNLLI